MVSNNLYPRTALTNANAIPVLPLVGSTMVAPGLILPSRSAASIMATPIRSLTEASGFRLSSLAKTVPPRINLFTRTRGVLPTAATMSL
jgi:hypothetical protein